MEWNTNTFHIFYWTCKQFSYAWSKHLESLLETVCPTSTSASIKKGEGVLVGRGGSLVAGVTDLVARERGVYLVISPKEGEFLSLSGLHIHGVPAVQVDKHRVPRSGVTVVTRYGHKEFVIFLQFQPHGLVLQ